MVVGDKVVIIKKQVVNGWAEIIHTEYITRQVIDTKKGTFQDEFGKWWDFDSIDKKKTIELKNKRRKIFFKNFDKILKTRSIVFEDNRGRATFQMYLITFYFGQFYITKDDRINVFDHKLHLYGKNRLNEGRKTIPYSIIERYIYYCNTYEEGLEAKFLISPKGKLLIELNKKYYNLESFKDYLNKQPKTLTNQLLNIKYITLGRKYYTTGGE